MKKTILSLLSLTLATAAFAEIRIPSSVFTLEEIEQAKEKATEDEEPLVFVVTDPGTS